MKIKAIGKNVILRRSTADEKSKGGLFIPEVARKQMNEGVVIAAGSEVKDVRAKDRVLFSEFAGQPMKHQGEDLLVVPIDQILGVMEG